MNRRNFLITPPALALAIGMGGTPLPALAAPAIITSSTRILPREGKKPPSTALRRKLYAIL